MATKRIVEFHNVQTGVNDGSVMRVQGDEEVMVLDIKTDATSLTVVFEGLIINGSTDGDWTTLTCYNYTDGLSGTQTTAAISEKWQVEVGAVDKFRARITTQTGGTGTTIIGKVLV